MRPAIGGQPFSTLLVLDRNNVQWNSALAQRYYLYPVHVSLSFLQTNGINSALYLMLLRYMNRNYEHTFRLADSVATDRRFSTEGLSIWANFPSDDYHPNAHACRLKLSLVTIDAPMANNWNESIETAQFINKIGHVSSSCRMALHEELQILESKLVVTTREEAAAQHLDISDYQLTLLKNRLHFLRALIQDGSSAAPCWPPPRQTSISSMYYLDKTVFGEHYNSVKPIVSKEDWHKYVSAEHSVKPEGGWLALAAFHVLWSDECERLEEVLAELSPFYMYPVVTFMSVRADAQDIMNIAKDLSVHSFPAIILFRGGKPVDGGRLDGSDRLSERITKLLEANVTAADQEAYTVWVEDQKQSGHLEEVEEHVEDEGELEWTWDDEEKGQSLNIEEKAWPPPAVVLL